MTVGSAHVADSDSIRSIVELVLPPIDEIVAGVPADLIESDEELRARIRLTYVNARVLATAGDLDEAIGLLRTRASGERSVDPFGRRFEADTFERLANQAEEALDAGRLELSTVLSLMYQSGRIAAQHGRRLILFLALNAHIRRVIWEYGSGRLQGSSRGSDRLVELGRWLLLSTELSSLATSEGYRATERELLARDAAAHRAALDELLSAQPTTARALLRLRRLSVRYGLDPNAEYRVAAILPGPNADPTPEEPGIDEADLERLAARIDQLLRRRTSRAQTASGIRVPLAITWRGSIVAILGPSPQEWQRLQDAIRSALGRRTTGANVEPWTAVAAKAEGVDGLAGALADLQEGLQVAHDIRRHGVIDDLAELGIERLLLSDPDLDAVIIDRELGKLLADPRMGEELVETLQTYFDCGYNRRETARRMHLADRTVAYRLERAEDLLGHGLEGAAGRRLSVALTIRRLGGAGSGG
jgi:PucR-like helix-turn-helix protein